MSHDPRQTADPDDDAITEIPLEVVPVSIEGPHGPLGGRLIRTAAPALTVQIAPATGVPAAYYTSFARWLAAEKNAAVLLWNYSDFSDRPTKAAARASDATMSRWGVEDAQAARLWLKAAYPELPLWVIGHSLGGLALPFQSELDQIDRVITVCAGPIHWTAHPWPMKGMAAALWHVLGPLCTSLAGYLPGHKLGLGTPLPKGVFWQWRRWCTDRASCLGDPSLPPLRTGHLRAPVTIIGVKDDEMIPPEAAFALGAWFDGAEIERRLITPAHHGLRRIGHISAFANRHRAVWPRLIAEPAPRLDPQ